MKTANQLNFLMVVSFLLLMSGCKKKSDAPADDPEPATPAPEVLSGPGASWTEIAQPSGSFFWRGITYGNNTWVAVGNGARATSGDGLAWNSTTITATNFYYENSVLFANGVFINTAQTGVSTSPNGTTWSSQTFTVVENLTEVAFGNNTWVIVDDHFLTEDNLAFFVSGNNGNSWAPVKTTIPYAQMNAVCFGNGKFIAVGYGGMVVTSADGSNWTQLALGSTSDIGLMDVAFDNGKFVIVTNTGKAYSSTDGSSWTKNTIGVNAMRGITFGNGVFVAVGDVSSIFTSPDAITWTRRTLSGSSTDLEEVAFASKAFVAVGSDFFATSK
jgi:hypothetical protein